MGKIIGIDLGSYNSSVSVVENGVTTVIPNSEGSLHLLLYLLIQKQEKLELVMLLKDKQLLIQKTQFLISNVLLVELMTKLNT